MADYAKLTVVQIRELFKSRNIATTGLTRKQQLIDRLLEDDAAKASEDTGDAADAEPGPAGQDDATEPVAEEVLAADSHKTEKQEHVSLPETETKPEQEASATPTPQPVEPATTHANLNEQSNTVAATASDAKPSGDVQAPLPTDEKDIPDASAVQTDVAQDQLPTSASISTTASPPPEESRKRKRRSVTPPLSEQEILKKKARQEQDGAPVILKEDLQPEVFQTESDGRAMAETATEATPVISSHSLPDAPAPDETSRQHPAYQAETEPSTSVEPPITSNANDNDAGGLKTESIVSPSKAPVGREKRFKDLVAGRTDSGGQVDMEGTAEGQTETEERDVRPALHPATSALYIRDLMRPLRPEALEAHLNSLAQPAKKLDDDEHGGSQEEGIRKFHLDAIRTHCFAVFTSVSAASRVRSAIHERTWPPEGNRKPLWADFIPEDKVQGWIEKETSGGGGMRGGGTKRWEVVYDRRKDGTVEASLEEATATPLGPRRTGTQGSSASASASLAPPPQVRRESSAATTRNEQAPASFVALDSLFKSTTAKPKLYYMPVTKERADKRLDELDALTSRHNAIPPGGSGYPDSRRYTFENGDMLVDNGPEFGLRQVRPPPARFRGR